MQYFMEDIRHSIYGRDFGGDFADYRLAEIAEQGPADSGARRDSLWAPPSQVANVEHSLADHVHLIQMHEPPDVMIDNLSHDLETRIDVIAGNRPGSLLELTQCITELGLDIKKAFVVSDVHWFTDNFWVVDPTSISKKVVDPRKLKILQEVMSLKPVADLTHLNTPLMEIGHTILELSGRDRPGLLAEITLLLHNHSYVVRSLAVWTQNNRAAFVLSVGDAREHHIRNATEDLGKLSETLKKIMGGPTHPVTIDISKVKGPIHHDRRLHKMLFDMEAAARKLLPRDPSRGRYYDTEEPEVLVNAQPWIGICEEPKYKNWEIHIKCKDRMKLMFDVCCALADLNLNVLGATIRVSRPQPPLPGQDEGWRMAEHYFYVLPRSGSKELADLDERAMYIHDMLTAALNRRHPPGQKVHIAGSSERLAKVAERFKEAGLTVTRARVRPFETEANHTVYLRGQEGTLPTAEELSAVCKELGGTMTAQAHQPGSLDSASFAGPSSFTYSLTGRIDRGWSGGPASGSSPPSALEHEVAGSLPVNPRHFG